MTAADLAAEINTLADKLCVHLARQEEHDNWQHTHIAPIAHQVAEALTSLTGVVTLLGTYAHNNAHIAQTAAAGYAMEDAYRDADVATQALGSASRAVEELAESLGLAIQAA